MRLEPVGTPDTGDLGGVQPCLLRHQPGAPVRTGRHFFFQGLSHDLLFDRGRDLSGSRGSPGACLVFQPGDAVGLVTIEPALDRWPRDAQLFAQRLAREPVPRAQEDLSPFQLPLRRRSRANPLLERFPVAAAKSDCPCRCHMANIQIRAPVATIF